MPKPPGRAGGLAGRSSSGSVSGLSSAVCASPAAGRGKASPERLLPARLLSSAAGSGSLGVVWGGETVEASILKVPALLRGEAVRRAVSFRLS